MGIWFTMHMYTRTHTWTNIEDSAIVIHSFNYSWCCPYLVLDTFNVRHRQFVGGGANVLILFSSEQLQAHKVNLRENNTQN